MRDYRNYTDEQIIEYAKEVKSIAELLKRIGKKPAGGNYISIKKLIQKLNVNTDHWTGQAWNKDQQLKDWKDYTKAVHLKPHLIKHRGMKCESCNLTEWQNSIIPLEVHHIDGNRTNNSLDNLNILLQKLKMQRFDISKSDFIELDMTDLALIEQNFGKPLEIQLWHKIESSRTYEKPIKEEMIG